MDTIIYIKNMVCDRCIATVESDLNDLNLGYRNVSLGRVELEKELTMVEKEQLSDILKKQGFELLESKNSRVLEEIKTLLRKWVEKAEDRPNVNVSEHLSKEIGQEYSYLSTLFSSVEGITIEKYLILIKVEKVKELMLYDELTISEIAYKLGYSSVQHLSNQFKKETGLTPTQWRKIQPGDRVSIDQVGKK